MFGLSIGELVVIVGVGSWALGPKELPRFAKGLGRVTGRAAGFVYKTRSKAFAFAEQNELKELHQELQATMHQLNSIKSELQGGIFNPGPLAQTLIARAAQLERKSQSVLQQAQQVVVKEERDNSNSNSSSSSSNRSSMIANTSFASSPLVELASSKELASSFISHAAQTGTSPAAHGKRQPASSSDSPSLGTTTSASFKHQAPKTQPKVVAIGAKELPPSLQERYIPVSAVAAGLSPDRDGSIVSGSEIMLDAIQEESVASHAVQFMTQKGGAGSSNKSKPDGSSSG